MATRRDRNGHGLMAVRVAGALLPPEFLHTIARLEATKQSGADYGLSKSLVLKDEIARYWRIANDLYAGYVERRERADLDAWVTGVDEWLVPFFKDVLGYGDISRCDAIEIHDQVYQITHLALAQTVPLLLTTCDVSLDRADARFGEEGRRRAPYGVVQELLNADNDKLWGVTSNGMTLRLLHDNPSLTRPAYIEADLERIFEEQVYADFSALWLTLHASRLRAVNGKPSGCILEAWREQAHEIGERALEHLRDGVTTALRELGNGFLCHPENESLRTSLADGTLTSDSYFQELLRLVYRLLFLFAAEDRHLLHSPTATDEQSVIYRDGYSVSRLRDRALRRRHYDRHSDLWQSLQVVFAILAGGDAPLGLPALGGLFSADQCSSLDTAAISNKELLEAVRALAFFRTGGFLARVNYRDMGTEELGSVYESLLELHPFIDVNTTPWAFGFVGQDNQERATASVRKLSGSYYTPAELVNEIICSALEPVMTSALKARPTDPRRALLELKIVDPACGSGHFLLAAAHRLAAEIARIEAGSDVPEEPALQHALREVVQHCIYGVDRNPLAVELCKAALWIETMEPGKPLTFLDPHVRCGDSLVGILDPSVLEEGIPDDAYTALAGDERAVCRDLKRRNRESAKAIQGNLFDQQSLTAVGSAVHMIDAMPENTLEEIAVKRAAWTAAERDAHRQSERFRSDLFLCAFFAEKTKNTAELVPINEDLRRLQSNMLMRPGVEGYVRELAERHRFFHWHVSFAEIMQRGGFDVVLGNPPWERIKLQEKEFFEQRSPTIAKARNKAERGKLISALIHPDASDAEKNLHKAFEEASHEAEASSQFVRSSGRFRLTAVGDINTYAIFAETFLYLTSERGRSGLVIPTGIATEYVNRAFFNAIIGHKKLCSLLSFKEIRGIFKSTDDRNPCSLLTIGRSDRPEFVFGAEAVEELSDARRRYSLSVEELCEINPNTKTSPTFRSVADAQLARRIYSKFPVLIDESTPDVRNPWGLRFNSGIHMSGASGAFKTASQLTELGAQRDGRIWRDERHPDRVWLPLLEAKMIHQYNHRWGSYETLAERPENSPLPRPSIELLNDPAYEVAPWYWIEETDFVRIAGSSSKTWAISWRDGARNTDVRSLIAAVVPWGPIVGDLPTVNTELSEHSAVLLGALNSLVCDYLCRLKYSGGHIKAYHLKQLAVPTPSMVMEEGLKFVTSAVLQLSYTSYAMQAFAEDLGYSGPPYPWGDEHRAWLRAQLDAYFARLYGLTRDELRYILNPADVYGLDYPSETFRVLREREIRQFGEYRTARLVLRAWDELESNVASHTVAVGQA